MSMHTQGPWEYFEQKAWGQDFMYGGVRVPGGFVIVNGCAPGRSKEGNDNARLIAAAPAMLEALRLCEAVLAEHEQYDEGEPSRESEAAEAARDAIAQATDTERE